MRMIEILLVEDNPGDVRLTREALLESHIPNNLNVVTDGEAALEFMERKGGYVDAPTPDMILLDLNLPKLNGHEVLERLKGHMLWRTIPVVVLTTSSSASDVQECYAHHVNCYITKPMAFDPFMDVIRSIENFWLTIVKLPPHERQA